MTAVACLSVCLFVQESSDTLLDYCIVKQIIPKCSTEHSTGAIHTQPRAASSGLDWERVTSVNSEARRWASVSEGETAENPGNPL
jgi:hypothetical protein